MTRRQRFFHSLACAGPGNQDPKKFPVMLRAADTILARPIEWSPHEGNIDCCYWWFGMQAMYQIGRKYWSTWSRGLSVIEKHQRSEGNAKGSWDPIGVWGGYGGRVGRRPCSC